MKTKLALLLALATWSIMSSAQTTDDKQNSQKDQYLWQAKINFHLPALDPEAIQIALVEFNPTEKFIKNFDRKYIDEQLQSVKNEDEKALETSMILQADWDMMFFDLRGTDVSLLTKHGINQVISANGKVSESTNWLVSKAFYLNSRSYCFILPLDMKNGSSLEVTLNDTNLISLTDLYNSLKK